MKNEIIEKGYDPTQFAAYLEKKKPGFGLDVNMYTLNELYHFVGEFINEQSQTYYNDPYNDYYNQNQNQDAKHYHPYYQGQ